MHSHPNRNSGNYVKEHRLVMENLLKRKLLPKEVVHHVNGDTTDNRVENLILFDNNQSHIHWHKFSLKS
jgi:hypothetical protein